MERTIQHTTFLPHAPEVVWQHLTDADLLAEWLMPCDFKPVVGHRFNFKTKSRPGFDGNIFCEVLEVVPIKKVSYSWRGGPGNGKVTLDSVVTWTLVPKQNGTELSLEHSGFKGFGNFLAYVFMNKGWQSIIGKRLLGRLNKAQNETAKT